MPPSDPDRAVVAGIPFFRGTFAEATALLDGYLERPGPPRRVATANLDFLALAHDDPVLRAALETADLVTADGAPILRLSARVGVPIAERTTGADLVPAVVRLCAKRGLRLGLLGGAPDVAADAAAAMRRAAPGLIVAGVATPRLDLADPASVAAAVGAARAMRADVLFVAFGCPKQDVFLHRTLADLGCRLAIGVGGTFDFVAGRRKRAPAFVGRLGFEWVVRWMQEPGRLTGRYWRDALFYWRIRRALPRGGGALRVGAGR